MKTRNKNKKASPKRPPSRSKKKPGRPPSQPIPKFAKKFIPEAEQARIKKKPPSPNQQTRSRRLSSEGNSLAVSYDERERISQICREFKKSTTKPCSVFGSYRYQIFRGFKFCSNCFDADEYEKNNPSIYVNRTVRSHHTSVGYPTHRVKTIKPRGQKARVTTTSNMVNANAAVLTTAIYPQGNNVTDNTICRPISPIQQTHRHKQALILTTAMEDDEEDPSESPSTGNNKDKDKTRPSQTSNATTDASTTCPQSTNPTVSVRTNPSPMARQQTVIFRTDASSQIDSLNTASTTVRTPFSTAQEASPVQGSRNSDGAQTNPTKDTSPSFLLSQTTTSRTSTTDAAIRSPSRSPRLERISNSISRLPLSPQREKDLLIARIDLLKERLVEMKDKI